MGNLRKCEKMRFELTVVEGILLLPVVGARLLRRLILERLIERDKVHGEAEDEDGQHREESREVLHEITNDNGPGSKKMMKRQEVQYLYAC